MANIPIQRQRETWFVTNVSNDSVRITDTPSTPVIKPGQRIDLLVYTSLAVAQSSTVIAAYISNGRLDSEEYLHTHDDKSNVGHTHELDEITNVTSSPAELTQLTDGSNADDLHKHKHNLLEGLNEKDYIHLSSAEKTELTTLTDGSNADDLHTHEGTGGVSKHNDLEEIQGGDSGDYYHLKKTQHDNLTDGSDADSLHTHNSKADTVHEHVLLNITDITATSIEINQALDGIGTKVIAANLDTLTDGSNADLLHTHAGVSTPDHNDLNGLNVDDYQHLTSSQDGILTGGASSDADSLHTHDNKLNISHLTDFTHSDITLNTSSRHNESHTIISHSDTTATGAELNTLTDSSDADGLHIHGIANAHIADTTTNPHDVTASQVDAVDRDFVNGTFRESFNALVTATLGVVTVTLTNAAGEPSSGFDLTMQFSDGDTVLDCSDCTVDTNGTLVAGISTSPIGNYIYILQSDKLLTSSTAGWPDEEHIKVTFIFIQSATQVEADGALINQNWNDHLMNGNNQGHLSHIGQWIREQGATWFKGCASEGNAGFTQLETSGTPTPSDGTEVYIKVGSGIISQHHRHAFASIDTSTFSDNIHIVNHPTTPYLEVSDLATVLVDSLGGALNGRYYNIVIGGVANKGGEYSPLMMKLPSGSYGNSSDAINDVDSYDDYNMPREFGKESSTGFYLARITLKHATGTNKFTVVNEIDLRGRKEIGGVTGGGVGGSITEFSDSQFKIFDNDDITRIIEFDAGSITGTKTITMADRDLDLADPIFTTVNSGTLSGNNSGDQDLSGLLLNTTDTFTGTLTVNGSQTINGTAQDVLAITRAGSAALRLTETVNNGSYRVKADEIAGSFIVRDMIAVVDVLEIAKTTGLMTLSAGLTVGGTVKTDTIDSVGGLGVAFNNDICIASGYKLFTDTIAGTISTDVRFVGDVDIDADLNVDGDALIDGNVDIGLDATGKYLTGTTEEDITFDYLNIASKTTQSALLIQGIRSRFYMIDTVGTTDARTALWINNNANLQLQTLNDVQAATTVPISISLSTGDIVFGNTSTQTATFNSRLVVRNLGADPTSSATAGTLGEIGYYNNKWYGKTVGSGTDTNWSALN